MWHRRAWFSLFMPIVLPETIVKGKIMKMLKRIIGFAQFALVLLLASCAKEGVSECGCLRLCIEDNPVLKTGSRGLALPDTNEFILQISAPDGSIIYKGAYGGAPEEITVPSGNCTVSVRSCEFSGPQFGVPQFGDDCCVSVPAGGAVSVRLRCRQLNSGVRLDIDRRFPEVYPSGVLYLKSDEGKLMYSYSEKRIAYFKSGKVSLLMSEGGADKLLLSRILEPNEVLVLRLDAGNAADSEAVAAKGVSISVDTARVWTAEEFVLGQSERRGASAADAMSIAVAKANVGAGSVWVKGYIVGGDLSRAEEGISFKAPFSSDTHLAVSARSSVLSKSSCLSVQLPAGDVRDALNLVDNPHLIGRSVCLKADIVESYFGLTGLRNVSEFLLE